MQKDRSVYVSFVLKSCKKFGDMRGIMYLCIVKKTLNV